MLVQLRISHLNGCLFQQNIYKENEREVDVMPYMAN